MPYAYGSDAHNGAAAGGATYGGLGTIGAYGLNENGMPAMGPYASLNAMNNFGGRPGAGGSGGSASFVGGGPGAQDPQSSAATDFLNSVISGNKLPYGQDQQNALMGQASAQNAAAEAQQNQGAQDAAVQGGSSASDPSLQSQYRQNAARRQTGNQRAQGDIQSQAGSANFAAQGAAAGALLSHQERGAAMQQQQSQFGAQMGMAQNQQAQGFLSNYFGGQHNQGMQGLYNPVGGWGA
jgi:hypothetical protein